MDYFKKNRLMVALVLVLVALNMLSIAFILLTPVGAGLMMGRDHVQSYIERELKLTELQKNQYADLRMRHFSRGDSMAVVQTAAMKALFVLLKGETVDTGAVRRNAEILGGIEATRSLGLFFHFRDVRALCTPEQQKTFDAILFDVLDKVRDPRGLPKPKNK